MLANFCHLSAPLIYENQYSSIDVFMTERIRGRNGKEI